MLKVNICEYFFIFRLIPVWNYLPDSCFNTYIVKYFKYKLERVDFKHFLCEEI